MAEDLRHRCDNCEGIDPDSCVFAPGGADELRRGYAERTVQQWNRYAQHWRERAETSENRIREVLQTSRNFQILYSDEVTARMEQARRAREAEARAEQAEAAIARVRELHKPFQRRDDVAYCDHCSVSSGSEWRRYVLVPWPCDTLVALDGPQEPDQAASLPSEEETTDADR